MNLINEIMSLGVSSGFGLSIVSNVATRGWRILRIVVYLSTWLGELSISGVSLIGCGGLKLISEIGGRCHGDW
jgi:hypothetical protein